MAWLLGLFVAPVFCGALAYGQADAQRPYYSRRNTFSFFTEYSPNSSHIIQGDAQNRRLFTLGAAYSRRLWLGRAADFQYLIELRPVMIESDPVVANTGTATVSSDPVAVFNGTFPYKYSYVQASACHPSVYKGGANDLFPTYTVTVTLTGQLTCSRQTTFGEGFSPIGFKVNFAPRHRIQPVLTALAGYMFSTQPIPVPDAGSYNFTYEFGAGFEVFRSREHLGKRSVRLEYRFHHFSNAYTASENPGVDSQLVQASYSFGR